MASRSTSSRRAAASGLSRSTNISSSSRLPSVRGSSAYGSSNYASSGYVVGSEYPDATVAPAVNRSKVAITTLGATGLAAVCYITAMTIVLSVNCPFTQNVVFFFAYILSAIVALAAMTGINMIFPKYNSNYMSITLAFVFTGTAALVIGILIESGVYGLCEPDQVPFRSFSNSEPHKIHLDYNPDEADSLEPLSGVHPDNYDNNNPQPRVRVGVFKSSVVYNYFIWFIAALGAVFQVIAFYMYG